MKDNTAALSSQFNTVYGSNAYNSFTTAWNNQSLKLSQYANALTNQDVATQQAARSNVRGFTDEFANGFTQSNAQVLALTINGWGDTLSRFAINLIDAQDARNFSQEYQLRAQTNQQLVQLTNVLGQAIGQQFPDQYGIPSAPAVPANVGSVNDNTNVASSSVTGAGATAGTGGADTSTGTADATVAGTAGSTTDTSMDAAGTTTAGDASAAGSTVLLPTTGAALGSSAYQVTGTTTTTGTDATGAGTTGAGASVTGTTTTTNTTGTSATGTTTSTTSGSTTTGSVLLPQTGADLSSVAQQVTGTATTTGTTGTSTTGTTTSTTTSGDTSTTGSGSVLLPQTGADLSSVAQQVTGTATTTGTTGTGATSDGTTTTSTTTGDANPSGSGVLLPQSGADLSQQQQAAPNTFVPIALVIAGVALIMAVVLFSFARRDYGQQKRDQ